MKNNSKLESKSFRYYLRGTGILFIIFAVLLLSCYGIASSDNDKVRIIFFSCFGAFCAAILLAYWIYAFIRERKIKKIKQDSGFDEALADNDKEAR